MNKPDEILNSKEVVSTTDLSRTTIWRLECDKQFPSRRQISPGRVGWLRSEVEAWLKSRRAVTS